MGVDTVTAPKFQNDRLSTAACSPDSAGMVWGIKSFISTGVTG